MNIKNTKVAIFGIFALVAFAASAVVANAYTFTQSLQLGSRGAEVMELQKFLNMSADTMVATTGAGSPGNETSYFGPATRAAVLKFQLKNNVVASASTAGAGRFGPMTRAAVNAMTAGGQTGGQLPAGCMPGAAFSSTTGQPCTPGQGVVIPGTSAVMLAASSPASMPVVAGQATADLAHFTFSGNYTVQGVTLQRTGISSDSTLSNVYLFEGSVRISDAASVSQNGLITFNSFNGLFAVNGTKTISVRADIAASTAGQTVGVALTGVNAMGGAAVSGLPVNGNVHSIFNATDLATASFGAVTPSTSSLDAGADILVWQSTLSVTQRAVHMSRVAFRNIGSINASDIGNFKLRVDGNVVATAAGLDANGNVTFVPSSPVSLATGSRVFQVYADVTGGASRTVELSLRTKADIDLKDPSYNANISLGSATPSNAGAITINTGSFTVQRDATSPSGNIAIDGTDVVLARYNTTVFGEALKIETLNVGFTSNDADVGGLRNGRVLINGVQVGSTATILAGGTNFTTNYTIMPGTPVMVEVRADIFDNQGTNNISNGDTIAMRINAGSSNAQRQVSFGSINFPAAAVAANTVTVATGSMSIAAAPNYGNQNIAVPQTNFKIAQFNLNGSSVEDINVSNITLDFAAQNGTTFTAADLTNVVVKHGNQQSAPRSTVAASGNNFAINFTLPRNGTVPVEVWANIGSTIDANDSIRASVVVSGTTVSGQSVNTGVAANGQTIAYVAGSFTATRDASTPDAALVDDSGSRVTYALRFVAVNDSYTITEVVTAITNASAVAMVHLKDGNTVVQSRPGATTVTFSGLNIVVPQNVNKVLTVEVDLSAVGVGMGVSQSQITTDFTSGKAIAASTGVEGAITDSTVAGNAMYVFKAVPTINYQNLPNTQLTAGTQVLARFTVSTEGTGTIAWKRFIFNVSKTGAADGPAITSPTLWDTATNTQVTGTPAVATLGATDTAGTISFVATNAQQISGSRTYELRASVAGTMTAGRNVSTTLNQASSFAAAANYAGVGAGATFVWSDESALSSSEITTDWYNDFLVRTLPTTSWTRTAN